MSLLSQLSQILGDAFSAADYDRDYGSVVVSQRPELAQFQCNGALPAAKAKGVNPRELAHRVIERITNRDPFERVDVAGPGFINITVTDAYLAAYVDGLATDERLGLVAEEAAKAIFDYGGPNIAKELHVGHLRPAIIGESLKRTFEFAGYDVVGDVHIGDWGTPMGQLIAELEDRRPDLPYFDSDYVGPYPAESPVTITDLNDAYPVASARAKDDPEFAARARLATAELQEGRSGYRALWQHFRDVSIAALRDVYDDLDVHFELWNGESTVNHLIEPMVERLVSSGAAVNSDGAVVIDVAEPVDKHEIPPLMLVKSDGAILYGTTDLATIEDRVDRLDRSLMIYVVDVGQALHFQQVFRAAYKTGVAGPGIVLEHAGNGTVNGPDGKRFRTRAGGLMTLRELIDTVVAKAERRLAESHLATEYPDDERAEIARKVGLAALKFGDLQNHRTSNYIFDVDRFVSFDGKTGPYLLYGAVRIKSILREAADKGLSPGDIIPPTRPAERDLMLEVARLPETVARTIEHRAPNHLAEYAYELVASFSRFYEECHILREPDPGRQASWLGLVSLTLHTLERLLHLLVIEAPERM